MSPPARLEAVGSTGQGTGWERLRTEATRGHHSGRLRATRLGRPTLLLGGPRLALIGGQSAPATLPVGVGNPDSIMRRGRGTRG